ncbi:tetratricopeptide repeat protein [Sphingosinicella sp. LHD-64]|uniref:tetratricopeptide repeat protein n=1 Tax=Sphingosinicella sp. LHD-64 TaxID=3072139 RepID=UPI00281038F7|nr:tetratricopeptide repeat protein [Sphingosinicella sp. LHD-64]MDQ8758232.1 tetratricopeptide repeat protein [Sphingosinicella sp. LHD-64]
MISSTVRSRRVGLVLLASAAFSTSLSAQPPRRPANLPPGAVVQPLDTGAGEELRRHLSALNENPRSVSALAGAGRAALDMGDPDAALTFFSRADEVSPRDARVKAGLAVAMTQLEQAPAALNLFAEAVQLGAPEAEIAGDRGLAYDSVGDPARAQRDYALALRNRDDPEIRRRMALSMAISGQSEAASRMIDAQLRRNDRAAWRTQAFILAMNGDTAGANRAAAGVMPAGMVQAMAPFFARLPSLTPAQKAMAAHFGHFPGNGTVRMASRGSGTVPPAPTSAPPSVPPPTRAQPDAPGTTMPPRRQWPVSPIENAAPGRSRPQIAELNPRVVGPSNPAVSPPTGPASSATTQPPLARFQPNVPGTGASITSTAIPASTVGATPGFSLTPSGTQPSPGAQSPPDETTPVVAIPARPFSEIAALVNELREEETVRPPANSATPPMTDRQIADGLARERARANPPARTTTAQAQPARPAPAPARATRPANPSRHWVQIATVPDRAGLAGEFNRLRGRASEQLSGRTIYTAPYGRSSSRLLVGPFDTPRAAQEFVNRLGQSSVSAFAWTSEAGQEIERLQTRR